MIEMNKKLLLVLAVPAAFVAGGAAFAQYPILDAAASRVVQKYQSSSCEQLWEARSQPKSPREQELINLLRNDPAARTEFINRIAAPVANKMFECGMIP
jgi:hypothetical protein